MPDLQKSRVPTQVPFVFIFFLALCLFSCSDEGPGYKIHGSIDGIKSGDARLLKLNLETNNPVGIDTVEIRNGEFLFRGFVDQPYLHTIVLDNDTSKIHLFLENSEITVTGNMKDLENVVVSGSREDSLFRSYELDDIFEKGPGIEIMLNYPDYAFAAFTAYYQFQVHNYALDTLDLIMNGFTDDARESIYYRHLDQIYQTIRKVAISQPAPGFTIPDVNGDPVSLDDFNGQYLLLDFWASWCKPCRAANPHLVEIYDMYYDRGFNILGISVDEDRDKWLQAIAQDQLRWTNVSNVKGWDEITDKYAVKAVPQNFLLDPDGTIIDKNIEPSRLRLLLDQLLDES